MSDSSESALAAVPQPSAAAASAASAPDMPIAQLAAVLLAQLVIAVALITPSTYSLAIRVSADFPASRDALLALAIGLANVVSMLVGPVVGGLSDRTRAAWGRRRTWLIIGLVIGSVGSTLLVLADGAPALVIGWCVAAVGYGIANSMVLTHLGDRLPPRQRGAVMGISSALVYLGPVVGVLVVGLVADVTALMFALPAGAALLGGLVLVAVMADPPLEGGAPTVPPARLAAAFWFDPRRHARFAWLWLNRAVFFLGVSFMTLYSVFFLATNLALDPLEVAATVSLAGVVGVVASTLSGTVAGPLSDRTASRLPFIVAACVLLCVGLLVIASSSSVPQYLVGVAIDAVAMGAFSAVGQALQFDLLPHGEAQNGRYLALMGLSQQLPGAVGPFAAAAVLALSHSRYEFMYIAAAALIAMSLLAVIPLRRRPRRASRPPIPSSPSSRGKP